MGEHSPSWLSCAWALEICTYYQRYAIPRLVIYGKPRSVTSNTPISNTTMAVTRTNQPKLIIGEWVLNIPNCDASMDDAVKGWNVPSGVPSISRTCCGLSQEMDSGKDLRLPSIIHVCDRNMNQIVLVKDFLYHWVVEPDDRGLLASCLRYLSETNHEINKRSPYGAIWAPLRRTLNGNHRSCPIDDLSEVPLKSAILQQNRNQLTIAEGVTPNR